MRKENSPYWRKGEKVTLTSIRNAYKKIYRPLTKPANHNRLISRVNRTRIPEQLKQKKNPTLIDVGCGYGHWVEAFRKMGFNALGVDIREQTIELAKRIYPESRFELVKDGLKYPKSGFDVVFCRAASFYNGPLVEDGVVVDRKTEVTQKLLRLGRPGGLFVLCQPTQRAWGETSEWNENGGWYWNTPNQVEMLLTQFGVPVVLYWNLGLKKNRRRAEIYGQLDVREEHFGELS